MLSNFCLLVGLGFALGLIVNWPNLAWQSMTRFLD